MGVHVLQTARRTEKRTGFVVLPETAKWLFLVLQFGGMKGEERLCRGTKLPLHFFICFFLHTPNILLH